MLIDERTQNRLHAVPEGGISHGTTRTQDLIPVFSDVVHDTPEYVQMINTIPAHAMEGREADWWNNDDAAGLLESLFDTLSSCSPEEYYFGVHLGDGPDYGFWKMDR